MSTSDGWIVWYTLAESGGGVGGVRESFVTAAWTVLATSSGVRLFESLERLVTSNATSNTTTAPTPSTHGHVRLAGRGVARHRWHPTCGSTSDTT